MAGHCPYLGLSGNRNHKYAVASSRHRCYVRHQPERIASEYQAANCLTSAYRRCPRLIAEAGDHHQPAMALPTPDQDISQFPQPIRSRSTRFTLEKNLRARPASRYTELKQAPARRPGRARRPMTLIEFAVLSLGLAILLACSFIGYAIFYRSQVGPGMAAAPRLAEGPGPTAAQDGPTLVPTFTPTLAQALPPLVPTLVPTPSDVESADVEAAREPTSTPTPTSVLPTLTPVTGLLTPIPEPVLLMPTPSDRPAAASPPTRLVIEKIGLDIQVLPVGIKTVKQDGSRREVWASVPNGGAFHQTSAFPGHPGNTVINGHRDIQGAVFRHLDRVEKGDEIVLYVGGVAYPYYVTEILVVPETFASAEQRAENLRLIGFLPEERLTLVTCTPVGLATHRLLVIAKPPDQVAPQMPEAGSDTHR